MTRTARTTTRRQARQTNEREIATECKLNPDLDLCRAAADFYLLETLGYVRGNDWARKRLAELETTLAREFAGYLDLAIGGELRHAVERYSDSLPPELRPFFDKVGCRNERGSAWQFWRTTRRRLDLCALELAYYVFDDDSLWDDGFGGSAWAHIVEVLRAYLAGELSARLFVDQCFDLEHNNGCVFNKLYDCEELQPILDAHGDDAYPTLLSVCSLDVRRAWRAADLRVRIDHDPIWLGVQPTDLIDQFADVA